MGLRRKLLTGWLVWASTAATCLGAAGLTLPKDLVLPANVAVAFYLPKQVRKFRSAFRSAGGFQTTDSVQPGKTVEATTLESVRHFFAHDLFAPMLRGMIFSMGCNPLIYSRTFPKKRQDLGFNCEFIIRCIQRASTPKISSVGCYRWVLSASRR